MNFRKRALCITLGCFVTAIGLLAASSMLRVYAAPAATKGSTVNSSSTDISVIRDGGVYYILSEGVDDIGDYASTVTDGYILLTLIKTDGYSSIGPFKVSDKLVDEVTEQCSYMLKGKSKIISQEEAKIYAEIAGKIQSGDEGDFTDLQTGTTRNEEYEKWSIEKTDNTYYFEDQRVRILLDVRTDGSHMSMKYDKCGDVSIRVLRDESGVISKVENLTAKEVNKILKKLNV